ncbi:MAG: glycosyltransferase family 4 protein [Myxococcota bacterium]|nr:glycosyltransferase family 4 protein [Myxococcota bacterium]
MSNAAKKAIVRRSLLFVTDVFPFPLDRGQHVRVYNLIAACARAFDVTFLGPPPAHQDYASAIESLCGRMVYTKGPSPSWRERMAVVAGAIGAAPGLPRLRRVRTYEPFVAALREIDLNAYDLIWAERLHIARLCRSVRTRTVVDLDDLEHLKIARLLKLYPRRFLAREWYRYALYRSAELRGSRRFLASVVCSEQDRAYLSEHGCENAVIVPNGVSLPGNGSPSSGPRPSSRGAPRIAFLGNLGYAPNADAVAFFARDVLPLLRMQLPAATFDVLGPGATPELVAAHGPLVRFRGFVEDLGEALSEYDMLVAPIRFGGGTKLKVLDAMAHRIPLVTTSVGAEGLSLIHREHAWIADSAEAFVQGVTALAQDLGFAQGMASRAYDLARDRFSWIAIQDGMVEWLTQLPLPPRS